MRNVIEEVERFIKAFRKLNDSPTNNWHTIVVVRAEGRDCPLVVEDLEYLVEMAEIGEMHLRLEEKKRLS